MKDLKSTAVLSAKKELRERVDLYIEKIENINDTLESDDTKHGYDNDDAHGELLGDLERYAKLREEHEDMLIHHANIDFHGGKKTVQEGAMVRTNHNLLLVGVGIGELTMMEGHEKVYSISKNAPIFEVMEDKKEGDTFTFKDKEHKILEIY